MFSKSNFNILKTNNFSTWKEIEIVELPYTTPNVDVAKVRDGREQIYNGHSPEAINFPTAERGKWHLETETEDGSRVSENLFNINDRT